MSSERPAKPDVTGRRIVWLLQDGEPLPTDSGARLMRTGDLAERLVAAGYSVVWWTSRFNHNLKQFRQSPGVWSNVGPHLAIAMLDGPGYPQNMSLQRVRHYRALAAQFHELAAPLPQPSLILGSYPSPELCAAGCDWARERGVPFVVDIRDPWPDMFPDYLPPAARWLLAPILYYYRRILRAIARDADSIVAVSNAMLDWGLSYSRRARSPMDRVFHIGFRRSTVTKTIEVPKEFTPERPLICLFATTCGASYDGDVLIDAARLLQANGERRIKFVVTGDGDMRPRWIARAKGLGSIHFTGWIPNEALQEWFRKSHVGLVLMRGGITRFWLGNKIFEYLSASLALINNVPGEPAAIVSAGALGDSVPPRDAAALAAALRRAADDPARIRRQMENARRAFDEQFDRESIQAHYVAHLASLINA